MAAVDIDRLNVEIVGRRCPGPDPGFERMFVLDVRDLAARYGTSKKGTRTCSAYCCREFATCGVPFRIWSPLSSPSPIILMARRINAESFIFTFLPTSVSSLVEFLSGSQSSST